VRYLVTGIGIILIVLLSITGCMSQYYFPATPAGHISLAKKYRDNADPEKAIQVLENAVIAYPDKVDEIMQAQILIGDIYREDKQDFVKAKKAYEKAIASWPESSGASEACMKLASLLIQEFRDFSKAKELYKKVIDYYPLSSYRNEAQVEYYKLQLQGY